VSSEAIAARRAAALSPLGIALLCGLVLLLEGYDLTAIAYTVPSLADAWHLKPAAFTLAQTGGSVGMLLGALGFGLLGDRLPRRATITAAVAVFGFFTLCCAFAAAPTQLAGLRFLTGLGLGGGIPLAIALASDHAHIGQQGRLVILMSMGVSIGNTLGGLVAARLVGFGWQWVFVVGGAVPLLLCVVLALRLPPGGAPASRHNPVVALWQPPFTGQTALLWAMNFLNLLGNYLILLWLPAILHLAGVSPQRAILGGTAYALGSIVGALATAPLVDRFGPERVLWRGLAIGALAVLLVGWLAPGFGFLLLLVLLAGTGIGGCQHGINSLSGRVYPPAIRATGAGWALGAGRVGMIIGPALGGILLALGVGGRGIFLLATIPALGTTLSMAALGRMRRRLAAA